MRKLNSSPLISLSLMATLTILISCMEIPRISFTCQKSEFSGEYYLDCVEGKFLIDTGTRSTLISKSLVTKNRWKYSEKKMDVYSLGNRESLGNSTVSNIELTVGYEKLPITLAGVVDDLELNQTDGPRIEGIIGYESLNNYVLTFTGSELQIGTTSPESNRTDYTILLKPGTVECTILVNQIPVDTMIDTGNFLGFSVLSRGNNIEAIRKHLKITRLFSDLPSNAIISMEPVFLEIQSLQVGGINLDPITVPIFSRNAENTHALGSIFIGVPFLEATRAIIDLRKNIISLHRPTQRFKNFTDDLAVSLVFRNNHLTITNLFEQSRLYIAGARVDDILTEIDGAKMGPEYMSVFHSNILRTFDHIEITRNK